MHELYKSEMRILLRMMEATCKLIYSEKQWNDIEILFHYWPLVTFNKALTNFKEPDICFQNIARFNI